MNHIFLFNPTGELAIANGMVSYMPPKKLRDFEDDLSIIPSFYAKQGDTVIACRTPDKAFLNQWHSLGLPALNYLKPTDIKTISHFNFLKPWSWNQAIHHKLKGIKTNASEAFKQSPNYTWNENYKTFFGRQTTNQVQSYIHQHFNNDQVNIPTPAISIYSLAELDEWLKTQEAVILKMPWSSSGRGIHVIDESQKRPVNYPWIKGALKQQGYITAEPLLHKKFDFSFQLNLKSDGEIDLLGISYFINDDKGHFTGGHIKWPHKKDQISSFLSSDLIHNTASQLMEAIKSVSPQKFYEGPLGVDAIVYQNNNGNLLIHPCLDINWRYNMGMVNISLNKYLHQNSIGCWKVGSFKPNAWNEFVQRNEKEKPLITSGSKIISGFIPMTPRHEHAHFGVWMEVWKKC